jgi:protein-tyrosine phosphatase
MADLHHTNRIKAFLTKHEGDQNQARKIVVHCSAGISRSAAVAAFAVHKYGIPLLNSDPNFKDQVAMTNTSMANPRLLRLLIGN